MPICCMCHQDKPAAAFAFRSIATGELQSHCRECHAAYRRQHYLDNKPIYIARQVARIRRFREQNRVLLFSYLQTHPCVDCGETDVLVLEFDHRDRATKKGDIGFLAARKPWHLLLREIEKCDVRCVNCHRRKTANEFNWAKASDVQPTLSSVTVPVAIPVALVLDAGELKQCSRCRQMRPATDFSIKNKQTGRRNTICGECQRAYGRAHYLKNRPEYLLRARKNRKSYRDRSRRHVVDFLVGKSCIDCGETDPLVLEFDHRDGVMKEEEVARLIARRQWSVVAAEIAKCDIRCGNCHRRRTARQFGWTKLALQQAADAR